jgi:hypothetical protein
MLVPLTKDTPMSNPKSPKPPVPQVPEELAAIDVTALEAVTGGTSVASESNALLGQVNDILGSIKGIKSSAGANGLKPQEMMLFMMLLQQRNQAQQPTITIAASPAWWGGRGKWW